MNSLKNTYSRVKETGLDGGKCWVSVTCKGGLTHTVWCGTLRLRQGSDVFEPWLPATKNSRVEQWPRADPPGCSGGHMCLLQGRAPGSHQCLQVMKCNVETTLGKETRRDPCLSFLFFLIIYPEFFSCCWLQDCEPSTLYQLDKWRNHSTLETKTLRTQQRKYNQVCNRCLLSFRFFQSSLEFSCFVADILLCTYRGCVHKWSFVFIESFL